MDKLSDFKPLKRIDLPGIEELSTSGLVVIVGPNSSGKSQLLQDLHKACVGEARPLVVASSIQLHKPSFEDLVTCLAKEGYLSIETDANGTNTLRPKTMYLGSGQAVGSVTMQQAREWYNRYDPATTRPVGRNDDFLNYFGRLLITGLFLERRLLSLSATSVIDFLTQPPQHDLHALHLNERAKD